MGQYDWVGRVAAEYTAGRPLALLFDYDGTLAPLAAHPSEAVLPPATLDVLTGLAAAAGVTVGVVSGRALRHLRDLVRVGEVLYAGSGGMHLHLKGEEVVDAALADFDQIADALVEAVSAPLRWFPGTWVERKPGCLAIHYRALTPLKAACFLEEVRDALGGLAADAPPLRVREVSRALEVALDRSWTKADAVDRLLAGLPQHTFPVYAGDAANDDAAVARVNALGGVTVGVGPEPPLGVQVRADTPEAFAVDLGRLSGALTRAAARHTRDHPSAGGC